MSRLLIIVALFTFLIFVHGQRSRIKLIDNGYERLVIAVNEKCGAKFSITEATDILKGIQVSAHT